MKASELRIGNLVESNKFADCQVTEISEEAAALEIVNPYGNIECRKFFHSYDELNPIPLTQERLLKFGFVFKYGDGHDESTFCKMRATEKGDRISFSITQVFKFRHSHYNSFTIKFVHQLQNLYFALTGEELTLK